MTTAIRYYSRGGNTQKLAEAISQALGVPAKTVDTPLEGPVDVLFLCSAVYAAGVDEKVKTFIAGLCGVQVKRVVNVSTAALLPSTYAQVSRLLAAQGIALDEREFHCRGRFALLHRGRPNAQDLADVQRFAGAILG